MAKEFDFTDFPHFAATQQPILAAEYMASIQQQHQQQDLANIHHQPQQPTLSNIQHHHHHQPGLAGIESNPAQVQGFPPALHQESTSPESTSSPSPPKSNSSTAGHAKNKSSTSTAASLTRPLSEHVVAKAMEDDKRRRNTAASARFRVKKKAREQALEQKVKESEDQMATFRSRIQELETENKWLKSLVLEKNEARSDPLAVLKSIQQQRSSLEGKGGQ
jgi:hypothetical protein